MELKFPAQVIHLGDSCKSQVFPEAGHHGHSPVKNRFARVLTNGFQTMESGDRKRMKKDLLELPVLGFLALQQHEGILSLQIEAVPIESPNLILTESGKRRERIETSSVGLSGIDQLLQFLHRESPLLIAFDHPQGFHATQWIDQAHFTLYEPTEKDIQMSPIFVERFRL